MIVNEPKVTLSNYVSYFFTGYNAWFKELGYPLLDVNIWPDGEWAILQCETMPVVPSLTQWSYVLTGIRNVEISKGFIEKYTKMLDLTGKEIWAIENEKTRKMEDEKEKVEENAKLRAKKAHEAITKNPDLMNRIGKFGLGQMDIGTILKHIPSYRL